MGCWVGETYNMHMTTHIGHKSDYGGCLCTRRVTWTNMCYINTYKVIWYAYLDSPDTHSGSSKVPFLHRVVSRVLRRSRSSKSYSIIIYIVLFSLFTSIQQLVGVGGREGGREGGGRSHIGLSVVSNHFSFKSSALGTLHTHTHPHTHTHMTLKWEFHLYSRGYADHSRSLHHWGVRTPLLDVANQPRAKRRGKCGVTQKIFLSKSVCV